MVSLRSNIVEVSCDHPTSAKDGFIEVSNFKGNYVYGSRAKYHCNPGTENFIKTPISRLIKSKNFGRKFGYTDF